MAALSHPQTRVLYRGVEIEVDRDIAPLLQAMWNLGYRTYGSCQDIRHGDARIWFETEQDRERFEAVCTRSTRLPGSHFPLNFPSSSIEEITAWLTRTG